MLWVLPKAKHSLKVVFRETNLGLQRMDICTHFSREKLTIVSVSKLIITWNLQSSSLINLFLPRIMVKCGTSSSELKLQYHLAVNVILSDGPPDFHSLFCTLSILRPWLVIQIWPQCFKIPSSLHQLLLIPDLSVRAQFVFPACSFVLFVVEVKCDENTLPLCFCIPALNLDYPYQVFSHFFFPLLSSLTHIQPPSSSLSYNEGMCVFLLCMFIVQFLKSSFFCILGCIFQKIQWCLKCQISESILAGYAFCVALKDLQDKCEEFGRCVLNFKKQLAVKAAKLTKINPSQGGKGL